jgi:hypothetical protein
MHDERAAVGGVPRSVNTLPPSVAAQERSATSRVNESA